MVYTDHFLSFGRSLYVLYSFGGKENKSQLVYYDICFLSTICRKETYSSVLPMTQQYAECHSNAFGFVPDISQK